MSLAASPEHYTNIQQFGIRQGGPLFAQATSPNFKLLFRCIQDVATRTRGNATGTNCNFKATTVGDVRKHQVRVHKDAVHWHTGCQSHFLGGLDDYNHHKSGCDIKVDIETDQAAKERAWRDLFRKMEPDLPFPDTPYKNHHCWIYPDAYDLCWDRFMRSNSGVDGHVVVDVSE